MTSKDTGDWRAVRDLQVGDEALIKGDWRRIRGFNKVTGLDFRDTGEIGIWWEPGQRFDHAILDKGELVQVRTAPTLPR